MKEKKVLCADCFETWLKDGHSGRYLISLECVSPMEEKKKCSICGKEVGCYLIAEEV